MLSFHLTEQPIPFTHCPAPFKSTVNVAECGLPRRCEACLRWSSPLTVLATAHTCCSYPPHFFRQLGQGSGEKPVPWAAPVAPCPRMLLAISFPLPLLFLHIWAPSVQQVPKYLLCSTSFRHVEELSQELNLLLSVSLW